MNEINHTDLLRALNLRALRESRELRRACERNDKLNERCEGMLNSAQDYIDELNAQRKTHEPK